LRMGKKFLLDQLEILIANVSSTWAEGKLSRDGTEEILAKLDETVRLIKEDY